MYWFLCTVQNILYTTLWTGSKPRQKNRLSAKPSIRNSRGSSRRPTTKMLFFVYFSSQWFAVVVEKGLGGTGVAGTGIDPLGWLSSSLLSKLQKRNHVCCSSCHYFRCFVFIAICFTERRCVWSWEFECCVLLKANPPFLWFMWWDIVSGMAKESKVVRAKPEEPVFSDDRSKRRKLTGTWHALQQPLLTVITPSMELLLLLIVSRFPFVEMVSPPPGLFLVVSCVRIASLCAEG